MSAHGPIGMFGKIRAQGDFLRINASEPAVLELVRFLEDGNEALHRAGARLGAEPIGFLFRGAGGERALVGALGPGEDKVGRFFPLAIFAPVSAREFASEFPLAPALYRPLLDAVRTLLAEVLELVPAQVAERLRALPLPGPADVAAAAARAAEAAREPASALLARLFGPPADGQRYYGFNTFQLACQPVRGRDPGRVHLALDCPGTGDADAWAWLELARRSLGWPVPPPFFWRSGAQPALLLSLGAPPPALLLALSTVPRAGLKIWPLTTQAPSALAQARSRLPAAQLAALDGEGHPVEELLAALSRP